MTKIPKQLAKNKITSLNLKNKKKNKDDLIGFIPNVLAAFSNFPKQFEGFTKLYNSIMLGDSGLTKLEREMIAVTVSSLNHCYYCIVAHGSAVRELSGDPQLGERLISNLEATNLAKKHQVMLRYVKELTKNPSDVNKKSRDELSKNGFSDRDIWDISLITGFFNMTNRLAIATEMEPNDIYHSSYR